MWPFFCALSGLSPMVWCWSWDLNGFNITTLSWWVVDGWLGLCGWAVSFVWPWQCVAGIWRLHPRRVASWLSAARFFTRVTQCLSCYFSLSSDPLAQDTVPSVSKEQCYVTWWCTNLVPYKVFDLASFWHGQKIVSPFQGSYRCRTPATSRQSFSVASAGI